MRKYYLIFLMVLSTAGYYLAGSIRLAESAPTGPQIIITQLKITSADGQFITLYNNTGGTLDLSTVQLQYFNNYDLLKATSSKLIKLSGKVPAHGYAVVNDGSIQACYQMTINSVSLDLSSTAGLIQVSHFLNNTSPQIVSILDDYAGWSKKATAGAQTLPAGADQFLQRKAADGTQNYSVIPVPGDGGWSAVQQPDVSAPCGSASGGVASGTSTLSSASPPIPYTVIASSVQLSSIPADDAGLAAPQVSEVLPNPAPPKTDENDEFIELYNPNDKGFDLSGFMFQVGTTTIHKYTFPAGTSMEPKKFTAFYSSDTGLSLSNSDGQVKLLDPGGNVLGQTDEYTGAKDDYAWVSAGGLWQWTVKPTPGAANIITSPVSKSGPSASSPKKSVKGAVTVAAASGPGNGSAGSTAAGLHPLVLAGVGAAALLYALYEYRYDLANFIYKLRRNRETRRAIG